MDRMVMLQLAHGSLESVAAWTQSDLNLSGPFGIWSQGNRMVVSDSGNHRCLCLDLSGRKLFEFGSNGRGPGQFKHPVGIAIWNDGKIAVSDKDNHRVQVFDE